MSVRSSELAVVGFWVLGFGFWVLGLRSSELAVIGLRV